jgi:hypothetical protein
MLFAALRALGSMPSHHHVRGSIADEAGHYVLEIGNTCECEPKLLALAALAPEIEEFLQKVNSPLANLILDKWAEAEGQLRDQIADSVKPAEKVAS